MRRGARCSGIAGVHRRGVLCYPWSQHERAFLYMLSVLLMSSDFACGWEVWGGG